MGRARTAVLLLAVIAPHPAAAQGAAPGVVQEAAQGAVREPRLFAAPGRAGGTAPAVTAGPPRAGAPMRAGFAVPEDAAAAAPALFRLFLEPIGSELACMDAARRFVAAAGRMPGSRELAGTSFIVFGADATVTLIDPGLRLGPAGLAGLVRLPGEATAFAVDPLGQRLFVATAAPPGLMAVDLVTRRAGAVRRLPAPAADLAWDVAMERLLLLGRDGSLLALDPEGLETRGVANLPAPGAAVALIPSERRLAVASGGAGTLRLLDPASLATLAEWPMPAGPAARLAVAGEGLLFAAAGAEAAAYDVGGRGRALGHFLLPAGVRGLTGMAPPRAAALLEDGGVAVLDAASGDAQPIAGPEAAAELGVAGDTLYLRSTSSSRLSVIALGALRPGRVPAPAHLEAGNQPFGPAPLPLMALVGDTMLTANPADRRIFQHHAPGMAAPSAVFTVGGSPVAGFAAVPRTPARTGPGRVELTAEAPRAGRWRLIAAVAEQGRAVCAEIETIEAVP